MIAEVLEKVLGWQVGIAMLYFGMAVATPLFLNKDRENDLAPWLMGAMGAFGVWRIDGSL